MQLTSTALLAALASTAFAQSNVSDPLVIKTNVGTFRGFSATPGVRTWLGIRYAAPANGTLRFRPPRRAAIIPSGTIFNATSYSPSCPELGGDVASDTNGPRRQYGEDCLSINIWAPSMDRLNSSGPGANVLVWIYGGGFTGGSSALALYNGSNFVRDQNNTIVVSVNYRTNMFGFPTSGSGVDLADVNPGLNDQRLAVEFIYNTIREFSGNPASITLFGESAGAASIGAWAYAYKYDPLASGLIMQSGSEFLTSSISSTNLTSATQLWNTVANKTGCALNATGPAVEAQRQQFLCLQQANFTELYAAVRNTSNSRNFLPTPNDITVFNQTEYLRRGSLGDFARLPVLIGSNENEGTTLGSYGVSAEALVTRVAFTCPAGEVVGDRWNVSVPTWQYRFQGQYPSANPPGTRLGSFHGSEISLVFGTYNLSTRANATSEQVALSKTMQNAWAVFAANPSSGLKDVFNWSTADPKGNDLILFGNRNSSVVQFNATRAYTFGCGGLYEDYFQTNAEAANIAMPVKRSLRSILHF